MQLRTFSKNTFFLLASRTFGAATTLLYVPLLARYLGIADYGQYTYIYAFVGLFETLSEFGLHHIFLREVARNRDKASTYLGNVLLLKAPLSVGVFILIVVISSFFVSSDLRVLVTICASEILLRKLFIVNLDLCRAFERMEYELLVTIVERTVALLGVLLVIKLDWGLTGVFLAFFAGAVVHVLAGLLLIWGRLVRPEFARISRLQRSLLKNSWPLGVSREAEVLYNRIGTVWLGQVHSSEVVGAFSGGYRIYQIASLVVAESISQSAFPVLSRLSRDPKRFTNSFYSVVRLNVIVGLLLAAMLWGLAPITIHVVFGPQFAPSIQVLKWISIAVPFTVLNRFLSVTLQSSDHQRIDSLLTISTLVINTLLNWMFIPPLGATGVAWALVISEVFSFGTKGVWLVTSGLPNMKQGLPEQL